MWDVMLSIYEKYGFSIEETVSVTMKGIDGMKEIQDKMTALRNDPPKALGSYAVNRVKDYNKPEDTGLPKSNVVYFELDDAWVAVRPSGTEPKIKYYFGVRDADEEAAAAKKEELKAALL